MKNRMGAAISAFLSAGLLLGGGILLIYRYRNPAGISAGVLLSLTGLFSVLILLGKPFSFLVPVHIRKILLMNIILNAAVPIASCLGSKRQDTINYFLRINNRMNTDYMNGRILLLLPRCIQYSECTKQLSDDIYNCAGCGKCQVAEIIELTRDTDITLSLVGGGTLALQNVRKFAPDQIIAVACENELLDGMRRTMHIPVWALNNDRPNGPCVNTRADLDELRELITKKRKRLPENGYVNDAPGCVQEDDSED